MILRWAACLMLLAHLPGCGDQEPVGSDAGAGPPLADAGDAAMTSDAHSGPVTGSWITTFVNSRGRATHPVDLSARVVGAWSEDAAGSFRHHPGKGTADGTFEVPGVPPGPFTFYLEDQGGRPIYLDSPGQRVLSLDVTSIGRPEVLRSNDVATTLSVSLFDLQPWTNRHALEIGFDTGHSYFRLGPPDRSVTHTEVLTNLLPLVDGPGSGDLMFASQVVRNELAPGIEARTVSVGAQVDSFTLHEFQANNVSIAMGALPERAVTFDFRQAAFAALGDQVFPGTKVARGSLIVSRVPDPSIVPMPLTSLVVSFEDAMLDRALTTSYRSVLPESWSEVGTATVFFSTSHPILGSGAPGVVSGIISVSDLAPALLAAPVAPTVSPPRAPTVNGAPATEVRRGVGTTPVLAWQPPALGTPTMYQILVRELLPEREEVRVSFLATLYTGRTRIRIPGGLFQEGGQYVLAIGAVADAGVGATHPFSRGPRRALAETVSARIIP